MRRSIAILLAVFALNAGSPNEAFSQLLSERFFIEARIRTALYTGDRGLQNVSGLEWLIESMGPGTELSLGYRWSESFDVVGQFSRGVYPGITSNSSNLTTLIRGYLTTAGLPSSWKLGTASSPSESMNRHCPRELASHRDP